MRARVINSKIHTISVLSGVLNMLFIDRFKDMVPAIKANPEFDGLEIYLEQVVMLWRRHATFMSCSLGDRRWFVCDWPRSTPKGPLKLM